jgi:hypothetical protein
MNRVSAVAGMAALLNSVTSKGPLNRAHTYKAAVVAPARPDATRPRRSAFLVAGRLGGRRFLVGGGAGWTLTGATRLAYVSLAALVLLIVALILQPEGVRSAGLAAMGLVVSLVVFGYALGFTRSVDDSSDSGRDAPT